MTVEPGSRLAIAPYGFCTLPSPRPLSDSSARIGTPSGTVWDVCWEDYLTDGSADYDDLIVRIEALPPGA